jgi:HipA-like protein
MTAARARAARTGRVRATNTTGVRVLEVRLGPDRVGTLTHLANETTLFAFDPGYLQNPARPTLSLGFKAAGGGLLEEVRPTRVRLAPFFSNLLPEGHLREYLAARGGVHPEREFFLLWLLGLPSPRFDLVPENEYAMMTLAAAAGIEVPEVRLVRTATIKHLPADLPEAFGHALAVRRFDRPAAAAPRVHIEDFAQVFGVYPSDKYGKASYGNLARVLWLETGEDGISEFVRRLVFSILIGNGDAHLKNWSLIYPDRQTPRLAPAYDLVATVAYMPNDQLALSLAGTKRFDDITLARFARFAEQAGLPVRLVRKIVRETAERVRDLWPSHEPLRALPSKIRRTLADHLKRVPL